MGENHCAIVRRHEELRKRLRALALLVAIGVGVMRGIGLAVDYPSLLACPWSAFTQPPCYGNAALLVCLEAIIVALLSPRLPINLARLRRLTSLAFALPALAVAWSETLDLAETAPTIDAHIGHTAAYAKSLPWVLFMVVYGVLIPNTWRRCAAVVGLFALLGLIPDVVVLVGHGVAGGPLAVYLANKVFWITVAAVIVVYGAAPTARPPTWAGAGGKGDLFPPPDLSCPARTVKTKPPPPRGPQERDKD